ncbi:MAG TPA: hypothetical protein VJ323_02320 [Bryobacteraceae bacterium]|jgi:hypothetical protein|nr:hypothetical protein [Bryobacteraceae bacterium]
MTAIMDKPTYEEAYEAARVAVTMAAWDVAEADPDHAQHEIAVLRQKLVQLDKIINRERSRRTRPIIKELKK